MIMYLPTDTLTCQVTPDSVEPTSLSCSVPPLDNLDLWTMLGAWATVGATLLLALFAWLAWRASSSNLELMRDQLKVTERSARSQIEDQEWGRQVDALANYTSAIRELASIPQPLDIGRDSLFFLQGLERTKVLSAIDEIDQACTKIASTGLIWQLHHARSPDSPTALGAFEDEIIHAANAHTHGQIGWYFVQMAAYSLLKRITDWQRDPSARHRITHRVDKLVDILESDRADGFRKANLKGHETDILDWPPR